MLRVVRHQREAQRQRVCGDLCIESADWLAALRKCSRNRGKSVRRKLIERKNRYTVYERIDETVESSGPFAFRTEAQFGESN